MQIKEAVTENKQQIQTLYYQLHAELPREDFDIPSNSTVSKVFIAVENEVVGFIWVNYYHYAQETIGYIDEMIVKTTERNKGVGTELIKYAVNFLKQMNATSIFISVSLGDEPVLDFYKKQGFKLCKGYWLYYKNSNETI